MKRNGDKRRSVVNKKTDLIENAILLLDEDKYVTCRHRRRAGQRRRGRPRAATAARAWAAPAGATGAAGARPALHARSRAG